MKLFNQKKIQIYLSDFFDPILQVFKSISRQSYDVLLFLIIPLIYLLNAFVLHYYQGVFFLGTVDPEYFYIFNGFVLSRGNLNLEYIAHPGIPLQFLIAISTGIISIFQPGTGVKDFIDDPEKYIHAANLFLNVLIAFGLFIGGIKAKKYSGSYFTGILFQLLPFGSASVLGLSRRLIPETIMIIPLLLLGLMVIRHIYSENKANSHGKDLVIYAFIVGIGMACKLSFLPVILVPLILLEVSLKQKIKLVLYSILFFTIFAFPVVFHFDHFWEWVSGIFTHTGKYGGGEKGLINFASIPGHIKDLFTNDRAFFYIAICSLLLSGLFSLKFFRKKGFTNLKIIRAIVALNAAIIVSFAFTLKHFALYYFMPFYLFKFLLVLLIIILVVQYQKISGSKKLKTFILFIASIFIFFMVYTQAGQIRSLITWNIHRNEILQQQYEKMNSLVDKDKPIIMSAAYNGAPFIAFAEFNGFIMTNELRGCYKEYLKEKFPLSYQYVTWYDQFYFWGDFEDMKGILNKTKSSFYIYIGKEKEKDLPVIEDRIWQVLDKNSVSRKVLYADDKTGEQLIEITPEPKP